MTLIDLSLPLLALLLLGVVLFNVRVEKRRARDRSQTVSSVAVRDVDLKHGRHEIIDIADANDDDLFEEPRPFEGLSRH